MNVRRAFSDAVARKAMAHFNRIFGITSDIVDFEGIHKFYVLQVTFQLPPKGEDSTVKPQ
jgi:hypothetical protein